MTIILGLDMSSTCIGYAVVEGDAVRGWNHVNLTGDIAHRCAQARAYVDKLLDLKRPTLVVIESPVARYAKAVIPQARVSGAVLAVLDAHEALWHETTPSIAKRVLAGDGAATKAEMIAAAADRVGCVGISGIIRRGGKWVLADGNDDVLTEDEADAIGLALVGAALPIIVKEAA